MFAVAHTPVSRSPNRSICIKIISLTVNQHYNTVATLPVSELTRTFNTPLAVGVRRGGPTA